MKKYLLVFMMAFGFSILGFGQAVLYEDFNYTPPAIVGGNGNAGSTSNNWTTHSVTPGQTTTIDVLSGNLSFTGLATSSGNKIYMFGNANLMSRDINRAFTVSTANVFYYSALVNVLDATQLLTSPDYFMSFGSLSGSNGGSLGGRLGIKSVNAAANYRLSIQNISTGTLTWSEVALDLNFGTTYLVVVKYDRSVAPNVAYLWLNPTSLGGSEPAGFVSNSSGTSTGFSQFASVCLRNNATTPKVEIDEIRAGATWADVTPSGAGPGPSITVTPTSLTGYTYILGTGPSAEKTFDISGANLTADITIVPPADYEISTGTGISFSPVASIVLTQTGGTVGSTTIYTRLKSGLGVGNYNLEPITASSTGASDATVSCSGLVTSVPIPSITVAPVSLTGFTAVLGTFSASQNYTVSGDNLTGPVTISAPATYEVSTDNITFTPSVDLPQSGGNITGEPVTVYTRINAAAAIGAATGDISHTSTGAANVNVNVTGVVIYPEPTNHADLFVATSPTFRSVVTTWSDNIGTNPATNFLILANQTGIFVDPVNGVPVANDASLNDGNGAFNVAPGVQTFTWNNLTSSTQYYFAIYAYSNTGIYIKYKTVPAAPVTNTTTLVFDNPIAAWTFDATPARPNTPLFVPASFGVQTNTATLYADGTNGSSMFLCVTASADTELDAFAGTTTNDPRESANVLSGFSYCPSGGLNLAANGKSMVIKFSMSALQNPILSFATRGTSSGFNTHLWEWSTDGTTFTTFGSNTAVTTSTFVTKSIDMSSINELDGAPVVYLKITFNGATFSTGNNRLDNIVIRASAASTIPPTVATTAATAVTASSATMNGTVNANNISTDVIFEYGPDNTYGSFVVGVPATITGNTTTSVSANLTGLPQNTIYHYRIKGSNANGISNGNDLTFQTGCLFPEPAGQISGPAVVCSNNTGYVYTVPAIPNATSYIWSVPPGSEVMNMETNTVTIFFGIVSGEISVIGTNDCGDEGEPSYFTVTVNLPVAVSVSIEASANSVIPGTTVTFTATPANGGATPSYQWKVNSLAINGATNASYAYIPVNGDVVQCIMTSSETCTTGSPATSNAITMIVNGVPADLTVTGTVSPGPAVCYNASSTITVAGGSSVFEVLAGGSATMIAGLNIIYLPGTKVNYGGYMHGYIANGGPYCTPAKSTEIETGKEEAGVTLMDNSFKIYPNPTSGVFTIEQRGDIIAGQVKVEVLGTLGGKILSNEFQGQRKHEVSIKGNSPGIYFVRISTGEKVQTVKIILTN